MPYSYKRSRKNPSSPEAKGPFFDKDGKSSAFFKSSESPIQTQLTIGKPGDAFEREADAVADKVVNQPAMDNVAPGVQREDDQTSPRLQMQEEQEEEVATKPELQMQEEQEEEVATKPELQMQEEQEEEVATKPELQMQEEQEEEVATKPESQSPSPGKLLTSQLQRTKGQGYQLPKTTQLEMGNAFGKNFSTVRIHTDQTAVDLNRQLKSQAFTHEKDIYFNQGKFDPESKAGKHLLAHELTHVVQQKSE